MVCDRGDARGLLAPPLCRARHDHLHLGSSTVALLGDPVAAAAIRDDRTPVTTAVEELLRFESPAKAMMRTVAETHDREGHRFEPGTGGVLHDSRRQP